MLQSTLVLVLSFTLALAAPMKSKHPGVDLNVEDFEDWNMPAFVNTTLEYALEYEYVRPIVTYFCS